ncbi:DUF2750 domain-containing protein [Haemophilus pittmaniae]|uniref:DUF2750 domain-containing protein n=1 Tax=Haemophilus pittmaniae TaxID=249188 RepID=UPI0028DCD2E5|nr:DUF2750 domain-containing protein [Haemophilus pittmaniae]
MENLQQLFANKTADKKYDLVLSHIVTGNKIWFLDKKGELIFYQNEQGKPVAPLWSDAQFAKENPPPKSEIEAVDMDVETFLLQFTLFLFNSQTQIAISPHPDDTEVITLGALNFARDLIEKIREVEGEDKALFYLNELKKIIK